MRYVLIVYVILFFSILTSAESTHCECRTNACRTSKAIEAIKIQLKKKAAPNAVPAQELAPAILRASLKYGLDYHLLTAVILVESRGVSTAYNKRSHDHGLGQINAKTAGKLGLSMACLYDWRCNLDAMARILSEINDGQICRYNVGTGSLKYEKLFNNCKRYEQRIALMQ